MAQVAAMGLLVTTASDLPDRPVERFADAPAVVRPDSSGWDSAHHDLGVRSPEAARGLSTELRNRVATAVNLAGLWGALLQLFGTAPIVVPYAVVAGVALVSTLLAVVGTVLPVGAALRARAVRLIGARE